MRKSQASQDAPVSPRTASWCLGSQEFGVSSRIWEGSVPEAAGESVMRYCGRGGSGPCGPALLAMEECVFHPKSSGKLLLG